MNRSWFRLPFGGGNNTSHQQQQDDEDDVEHSHDSGEMLPALGSSRQQQRQHQQRRSRTSNSSGGRRDYFKQSISGPYPSPLAATSDTTSYATAQASSIPSECSTAGDSLHDQDQQQHVSQGSRAAQQQQHVHTSSLHSISSIRTAHFTTRSEHFERLQRSTTPEGSMEVSPSKTPLRDRMNRLSIASTASGMVNFDDEDREEAERRWLEEEEVETGAASSDTLPQVQEEEEEEEEQLSSSEDEMGYEEQEGEYERPPQMTPSRSSTSVKSILKKSVASAEGIQASNVSIHATTTPHRTVTWSPSTLPAAKSPPTIEMSPEHPRGPLAAAEAYLLNLGQRQQDEYYQGFDSPYRQVPNREDESIISSEDSAMEIEEALLSRSSNSISPNNLSAASDNIAPNEEESTNSLRLHGSNSTRGIAFMDRLKGLIPSPEGSSADPVNAQTEKPTSSSNDRESKKILDPSMSNILDTSAPMQSMSQDVTVNESHVNTTLRQANGPKPFLLRQSVILEEPSLLEESVEYRHAQKKSSTSPTTSPGRSVATTILGGQSFVTAMQQPSPASSMYTPIKQSPFFKQHEAVSTKERECIEGHSSKQEHDPEMFETPAEEPDHAEEQSARIVQLDEEADDNELEQPDASPSPSLRALPSITPSSSSSSLIKVKADSPFTSLVNHLLNTQDELLLHRADQKTMLISLVSNLRGELASRDRQLDLLESNKKLLERNLRKEKEEREKEKLQTKDKISNAFEEVDDIRNKLVIEIKRRDDAFKEELLHERTKRELVEKQLESLRRNNDSSEEIEFLRNQLQDTREALDEEKLSSERTLNELQRTNALLEDGKKEMQNMEMRLDASQRAQEDALAQVDMRSEDCDKLRQQTRAADKQITNMSADFDHQMIALRTRLNLSESSNIKLRRELEDVKHALQEERLEQTRQYDMSASVQESLRIDNERLASSVARLERSKENSFHQLQVIKKDTAAVLAQKEDQLANLEAEILKRSLDRRTQFSQSVGGHGNCPTCKEANERNGFLESEIARLREIVGKMRMESADREVKIARLNKTREQLKEDIEGLNIALEAKQMEVSMLKRESHRVSGGESATIIGAGGVSMVGMTTSTTRPHSRILKGRPSSLHDTTQGAEAGIHGSTTFTAEQRKRSMRARPNTANPGKRISIHRSSIDTPGVLSTISANSASGNVLSSALTSRRTSSKDLNNPPETRHEKALEAASLIKTNTIPSKTTIPNTVDDKENTISNNSEKAQQRIRDLPSAPSHAIVQSQQQIDARKRSNSTIIPIEA